MKKLIAFTVAALIATVAYANCTTTTVITPDGKAVVCNSCCYAGNCTVTCM